MPAIQIAKAQYVSSGGPSASLEEQLKLAREKVQNAKQTGAYGSGTPMLGVNLNETEIYIIAIVIIFPYLLGFSIWDKEVQEKQK